MTKKITKRHKEGIEEENKSSALDPEVHVQGTERRDSRADWRMRASIDTRAVKINKKNAERKKEERARRVRGERSDARNY